MPNEILLPFFPRDAMLAWYMLSSCVRPSQAGIVPKRLRVRSGKQRRTIANGISIGLAVFTGLLDVTNR